jgi:pimeloyl-ACP methyl ester carboxylesterase
MWLLFNGQTAIGKALAVLGVIVTLLPATIAAYYQQRKPHRFWRWCSAILSLSLIGIVGCVLIHAPSGHPQPGSPAQHRYSDKGAFPRFALANIIPESEQINLGFLIMPYLDPILTVQQAHRVSAFTLALYDEMESDPDFRELGSAMNWSYAALFNKHIDVGHYYLYVPHQDEDNPMPVIVFLHGSAGNFKAYLWVWSRLAEELGLAIITPSCGFGTWDQPCLNAVLEAIEDASTVAQIDHNHIYLAGLSNGGLGATRLAEMSPNLFAGLILISPVLDSKIVHSQAFQDSWRDRPTLVVTGEVDRRVPLSYVEENLSTLRSGGVTVTGIIHPGEDHFLFFSQPWGVLNDVADWLSAVRFR